ncbi:hypothetical protein BAK_A0049 (plasmid) [Bacillus anthracis str. A0389]|nr:hypothetical protein BAA_A0154 [Bacillus anthracis str. A0248]EDR85290.1 hypothetical protein BAQ_A0196 [Bacillus anthracis str. A0193]EDR90519.1 hypothetical protein BAH_A0103 [Bacillus anthracis str. A0442]EDS94377.1 hypothetical protein BAK_A0049 [Bacillus anthracis str. A0389]EDT17084.1 hypothetical protein BAM_A0199 [Bacillus anthracis str. A0465]EDV13340.1 hypothetical protein BATI_B0155 [Bacillus anthracis str. Tsiankovskii-I]
MYGYGIIMELHKIELLLGMVWLTSLFLTFYFVTLYLI